MKCIRRIRFLLRRLNGSDDLAEELRIHQQMRRDDGFGDAGFGSDLALRERSRDAWGWLWLEQFAQDLRLTGRRFRRAPGFALLAIAILAIGIGANTALFSVVDAVLLRPLPYPHPEQLVQIENANPEVITFAGEDLVAHANAWVGHVPALAASAAYWDGQLDLSARGVLPLRVRAAEVSPNFFDVIGVRLWGPGFIRGAAHQIILSQPAAAHFGLSPGRQVQVNGEAFRVAGIAPGRFGVPDGADAWIPLPAIWRASTSPLIARAVMFEAVARLRPGATPAAARKELAAIAKLPASQPPLTVMRLRQYETMASSPALWLLLAAVGMVLLIACVNVANLQLTRARQREREFQTRVALGASRGRLARQHLTEAFALAAAGAIGGLVLAAFCLPLLRHWLPASLPLNGTLGIDARVLGFTVAAALAATLSVGLLPLLHKRQSSTGGRLRGGLAVAEIALALILLAGAGLLLRSLARLAAAHPGFAEDGLLTAKVDLVARRYDKEAARVAFYRGLRERLMALPGVTHVAFGDNLPLDLDANFTIPVSAGAHQAFAYLTNVSPGFFAALDIPLLAGRDLDRNDNRLETPALVVNRALAIALWGRANPVGRQIAMPNGPNKPTPYTVAGEVGSTRLSLDQSARPNVYLPLAPSGSAGVGIVIRTSGNPAALAQPLRRAVAAMDPNLPVSGIATMRQLVRKSLTTPAFRSFLLGLFALLALGLSVAGLATVMASTATLRRHEIGVRMALGAQPVGIAAMMLAESARLIAVGLAIGLAGALALAHLLQHFLYGVSAYDPAALGASAAILATACLAACWLPAARAAHADPLVALRCE